MPYICPSAERPKYICTYCDYSTSHHGHWVRHLKTQTHLELTKSVRKLYTCSLCGKAYKHRQSLHTHKKKCKKRDEVSVESTKDSFIENLSKDELIGIIKEMIPHIGGQTTNINVQVFLDEKCKDAMTIQNFATRLKMTIDDIMAHKQIGISTGVSNILIENLRPIPLMERPIHCTDGSGATWMVHDETDGWKTDTGKTVMKEAGFGINRRFQDLWNAAYPNWQYNEMLQQRWIELVKCLNADPTEKEIEETLKKLGPECRLTAKEITGLVTK